MLKKRESAYNQVKNFELDTSKKSVNKCAKEIIDEYMK
jgi:chloramphenicol 3-O-phosphotransferase